jgi:DNA repair protein RadC
MNCLNKNFTIKDIPEQERPRERLEKFGPEVLSNAELLAIILRTGTRSDSALNLANRLLSSESGVKYLYESSFEELKSLKGIGTAKASQIKAALELGRRLKSYRGNDSIFIRTPGDAAELVMEDMRYLKKECLKAIMLNIKNMVTCIRDISIGSINSSIVHPREIFVEAIKVSSASIIICHNHPSGDPTPSQEDISVTRRIFEAGKIIGIDLIDHVIIGDGKYVSLKEKNVI